ncbi:DUF5615 family PIN-like protein [Pedobacter nototheniae]|uniref:DUF5615 family PIN-like protein n=1 Tax=Pedobacter nototheniae TaxID=2488994 RepID=UPI00103D16EC|nr:DUF5615 family PIN-like protein [Pedobacter nototheniae]
MNNWEFWIDTNISPIIAKWISEYTGYTAKSSYSLNLHFIDDIKIYTMARNTGNVILISKDSDFNNLIEWYGSPPKLINIKFGNCSNHIFWDKLKPQLNKAIQELLINNMDIVNIG